MENMNDLFELMGWDPVEKKEPPKQEKKSKPKKKILKKYTLPFNVSHFGGEFTLVVDDFNKTEVTESEIKDFIFNKIKSYAPNITILEIVDSGNAHISIKKDGTYKGSFFSKEKGQFYFGDTLIGEFSPDPEDKILIEPMLEAFKSQYPHFIHEDTQYRFVFDSKESIITIVLEGDYVEEIQTIDIDSPTVIYNQNQAIDISIIKDKSIDSKTAVDEVGKKNRINIDALLNQYHWKKAALIKGKATNTFILVPKSTKDASKTETSYSIENVKLSLLFKEYILNKEDFGGKEKATESDLLQYLVNNGHNEFKFAPARFVYSEKLNTILVSITGSKKGTGDFIEHPCFTIYNELMGAQVFQWIGAKVPKRIWQEGYLLSKCAYFLFQSEIQMELYYCKDKMTYHWYVPKQVTNLYSTSAKCELYLRTLSSLILVGQFHSHSNYPSFFSATDNYDEKILGIYGVWGNLQYSRVHFCIRCVIEVNRYLDIEMTDVFDCDIDSAHEFISTVGFSPTNIVKSQLNNTDYPILGYLDNIKCIVQKAKQLGDFYRNDTQLFVYDIELINKTLILRERLEDDSSYVFTIICLEDLSCKISREVRLEITDQKMELHELFL